MKQLDIWWISVGISCMFVKVLLNFWTNGRNLNCIQIFRRNCLYCKSLIVSAFECFVVVFNTFWAFVLLLTFYFNHFTFLSVCMCTKLNTTIIWKRLPCTERQNHPSLLLRHISAAADDQAYNLGVAADNDNDKIPPSSSKHHQPKTSSSSYGKTKTAKMPPPPKWKNVTPAWEKTARLINSRLNRLKVDVVRVAKRIKAGDLIDNVHLNKKGYTTLQMINCQSILN